MILISCKGSFLPPQNWSVSLTPFVPLISPPNTKCKNSILQKEKESS
jgi:hypothetical protein